MNGEKRRQELWVKIKKWETEEIRMTSRADITASAGLIAGNYQFSLELRKQNLHRGV
jgi:hypothetical protein